MTVNHSLLSNLALFMTAPKAEADENDEGKLFRKVYECYNRPFFDNEGTIHIYKSSLKRRSKR
jgi:hypothetical protein